MLVNHFKNILGLTCTRMFRTGKVEYLGDVYFNPNSQRHKNKTNLSHFYLDAEGNQQWVKENQV